MFIRDLGPAHARKHKNERKSLALLKHDLEEESKMLGNLKN